MFELRSKTKWYWPPGKWFYGPTPLPSGISWASDPPTPLEFPIPSMVGVWIFSGTTQFWLKEHLIPSMEPLKWRNIHDLYTMDTSLIRTLCSVPSVSVLERFDCICLINLTSQKRHVTELKCIWPFIMSGDFSRNYFEPCQYGISVAKSQTFLLAKHPQRQGAGRNGCAGYPYPTHFRCGNNTVPASRNIAPIIRMQNGWRMWNPFHFWIQEWNTKWIPNTF